MKFSERIGKTSVRTALQVESVDEKLKNRLWNTILDDFFNKLSDLSSFGKQSDKAAICLVIWKEFFGNRSDEIPTYSGGSSIYVKGAVDFFKKWFLKSAWYEKYDFIEFLSALDSTLRLGFIEKCNNDLAKEMAGYRIVDRRIVQITSEEEIREIEDALGNSNQWSSVGTHLTTALDLLSNRDNPDYRNSVKESISAVESLCVIITGDAHATLGKALTLIEQKYQIHRALKNAFSALYGFTSDSGGIRHSLLEDDISVTMEDAKFMLVSCSAFINYLKIRVESSN